MDANLELIDDCTIYQYDEQGNLKAIFHSKKPFSEIYAEQLTKSFPPIEFEFEEII